MNLPKYTYRTNGNFLDYEFDSVGPKGTIRKAVRYTAIDVEIYNLGFGDLDEASGDISDTVVTDNKDSKKVLATVASTLYDFFDAYPGVQVFVKGSTPAKTRLYRIGVSNNLREISMDFELYGLKENKWETFRLHETYDAFLVKQKDF